MDVRIAQGLLNRRLGTALEEDGKLGPATQEAISRFQAGMKLPVTGKYDPKTQEALETEKPFPAGSRPPPPKAPVVFGGAEGASMAAAYPNLAADAKAHADFAKVLDISTPGSTADAALALARLATKAKTTPQAFLDKIGMPYPKQLEPLLADEDFFKNAGVALDSSQLAGDRVAAMVPLLGSLARGVGGKERVENTRFLSENFGKLAPTAGAIAAAIADPDPANGLKNAMLVVASLDHDGVKGEATKEVFRKLSGASTIMVDTFTTAASLLDPKVTTLDKAKAVAGLAKSAPTAFAKLVQDPVLERRLAALAPGFTVLNSTFTLFDPKAKPEEKALAAATLLANVKEAGHQLAELRRYLGTSIANLDDAAIQEALKTLPAGGRTAIAATVLPKGVAATLSADELVKVNALIDDEKLGGVVKKLLPSLDDAAQVRTLLKHAATLEPEQLKTTLTALSELRPAVVKSLIAKPGTELARLTALVQDTEVSGAMKKLLPNLDDAAQLRSVLQHTATLKPDELKTTLSALSDMRPDVVRKFISSSVEGKPAVAVLNEVLAKIVSKEGREGTAKLIGALAADEANAFLKMGSHLSPDLLALSAKTLGTVNPALVGKVMVAAEAMVAKAGVRFSPTVAAHMLSGLGKAIPAIGAAFAGKAIYDNGAIALDQSLPPEIRFMAMANAKLNVVDAGLGVMEALGVGNVAFLGNAALALGEFGLDLKLMSEIERYRKAPGQWKSTPGIDAIIGAAALDPVLLPMLAQSVGPQRLAEIYKNTAAYPFKTVGGAIARTYGQTRAAVGNMAAGGTVAQLTARVAARVPLSDDSADTLHQKNEYFREEFLIKGSLANYGFTDIWKKKLSTDPEAVRLMKETRYSPYNEAKERDLAQRLQKLATEFLKENEKKLNGL